MGTSRNFNFDKSVPFFEDVDDATFLRSGRGYQQSSTIEDRQRQLLEEKRKIEDRTIQSSFRSIGLLKESEQVGSATAEELVRQREQLQNAETKLDEINSTLRVSQRHIQGIKSVFGSIKNYFAGGKNDVGKMRTSSSGPDLRDSDPGAPTSSEGRNKLSQILERTEHDHSNILKEDVHPVQRLRSDQPLSSRTVDDILDNNLEEIGVSISRLKGLGLELNREIEDQNSMLDRITNKTEDVDFKVKKQNTEMNRILKK